MTHEFVRALLIGIVIGWGALAIILQIAYRMGIVDCRGHKQAAHAKGDA